MKRNECKEIILTAGKKLLEMTNFAIEEKTDFKNLVTTADEYVQNYLMTELKKVIPTATYLCEENHVHDTSGEYTFIIDPIDGTSNFIFNFRQSAISVALADAKEVIWGIVYNPFLEELYEAEKGKGAFLNGKPIHVIDNELSRSLVVFGTSPYYGEAIQKYTFDLAMETLKKCIDLRRSGSAALDHCYTARGTFGLYFELEEQAWDFAAGSLIVREAGGVVVNFDGRKPDFTKKSSIIAGNEKTVREFFTEVLKKEIYLGA